MQSRKPKWTHGYRAEYEYTFGIYPVLLPENLLLTVALQGVRPATDIISKASKRRQEFVYCELGCGQGLSTNFLAARDPDGQYIGVDYNPNQIRNARQFSKIAGIENVKFLEESFSDLINLDIPQCDIISLHGVWSWIEAELRENIVDFLYRKLKPGGVVYISYNCAVGRSVDDPMRRLLVAAERISSQSGRDARVTDAITTVQAIAEAGARYFQQNGHVHDSLKELLNTDQAYVEHEYLNSAWTNFFFDQVNDSMSRAKLSYIGSTTMSKNIEKFVLNSNCLKLVDKFSDINDVELFKDICADTHFRQDLFVKGVQKFTDSELNKELAELNFTLKARREDCTLSFKLPAGPAKIPEKPYTEILNALAVRPRSGSEILAIVEGCKSDLELWDVISALLAIGYIVIAPDRDFARIIRKGLQGFEKAYDEMIATRYESFVGVSESLATVIKLKAIDYYFWLAYRRGIECKPTWVMKQLSSVGRHVQHNGKPVTDPERAIELLAESQKRFEATVKPLMDQGHNLTS